MRNRNFIRREWFFIVIQDFLVFINISMIRKIGHNVLHERRSNKINVLQHSTTTYLLSMSYIYKYIHIYIFIFFLLSINGVHHVLITKSPANINIWTKINFNLYVHLIIDKTHTGHFNYSSICPPHKKIMKFERVQQD